MLLLLLLLALGASARTHTLPMIDSHASPYQVRHSPQPRQLLHCAGAHQASQPPAVQTGKAIGESFRSTVREFMAASDLHAVLLPFYATVVRQGLYEASNVMPAMQEGQEIVETFYNTVESVFPLYLTELRGIADGAGVNFTEVWRVPVVR